MRTHSVEANQGIKPTIAHVPTGIVHGHPLEEATFEKVPPNLLLVGDNEVYSLSPIEVRFREACQFYALFKNHHGPEVGLVGNRFLWICYVDAFLMSIVSLKDLSALKSQFDASDLFRLMVVMRNATAHKTVVSSHSPLAMVSRDISVQAGAHNPDAPDHENPVLAASKIAEALTNYEAQLKAEPLGKQTRWDRERKNVEGALRWNALLAAREKPRVLLSEVFLDALQVVAGVCGFVMPPLP